MVIQLLSGLARKQLGYTPKTQGSTSRKKYKIAVVGVGSAGILTLTHLLTWLDTDWEVYSIYDPNKPILGIGESTNGEFVALLERGLHFSIGYQDDMARLDATPKYGSKFMDWREYSWINRW